MANTIPSISNSFIYRNSNLNHYLEKVISSTMEKGIEITNEEGTFQYEFDSINRYLKFPMKIRVMDAFKQGRITLRYNPRLAENKIPVLLPFIVISRSSTPYGIGLLDNYISFNDKNGGVSIDPKKLYCILEGTYVATLITEKFKVMSRENSILLELTSLYAHMITRVLNKRFALNVDKRAKCKVLFLAAKFFLVRCLGYPDDTSVFKYAARVSSDITEIMVRELNDVFSSINGTFVDISTFIKAIETNGYMIINGLRGYTVREFIKDFLDMYGSCAVLGLEDFRYFSFNVLSAINGGFLNKQYIFDELIGTRGGKIYSIYDKHVY